METASKKWYALVGAIIGVIIVGGSVLGASIPVYLDGIAFPPEFPLVVGIILIVAAIFGAVAGVVWYRFCQSV